MLLEDLGLVVEAEEHRDPGMGDQGPKGRRRRWRGHRRRSPGTASLAGFLLHGLGPGRLLEAGPCCRGCHCSDPARIPPEPSASSASSSYACGCGRWRGTAR